MTQHKPVRTAFSLLTSAARFAAAASNRPGLLGDTLRFMRRAGIVPASVATLVRGDTAELGLEVEADERQTLSMIAQLEAGLGIMFERAAPLPPEPLSEIDTTRLRIDADAGEFGEGAWLLIARGGEAVPDLTADAVEILRPLQGLGDHMADAVAPGRVSQLERLLAVLRAYGANIQLLDASDDWADTGRPGINAIFHMPAFRGHAARRTFTRSVERVLAACGATLIELSDLALPDQHAS